MNDGLPQPYKAYRLFVTNGRGRIDTVAQEVLAMSDQDAIATARDRVGRTKAELWSQGRTIAMLNDSERDANRSGD